MTGMIGVEKGEGEKSGKDEEQGRKKERGTYKKPLQKKSQGKKNSLTKAGEKGEVEGEGKRVGRHVKLRQELV